MMTPGFCKFLLKLGKWEIVGLPAPEKHCIYLEAPHTSIWDFLIGFLYYGSFGRRLKVMIKKESFFFPFGYVLKALGGFPIDRRSPQKTIMGIVHEMESSDKPFWLAICPEGTRKAVHKWKTGYHTIARATGIPVYVTFVDWGHKRVGIHSRFELTGDARADTDRLQKVYEDLGVIGKHPEMFVTK